MIGIKYDGICTLLFVDQKSMYILNDLTITKTNLKMKIKQESYVFEGEYIKDVLYLYDIINCDENYIEWLKIIWAFVDLINMPHIKQKETYLLNEITYDEIEAIWKNSTISEDGYILTNINERKIYKVKEKVTIDLLCVKTYAGVFMLSWNSRN